MGLGSLQVSEDCSHKKGTKMFSSGGIAANQAAKRWKYLEKFTGEMNTGCGSFYLLQSWARSVDCSFRIRHFNSASCSLKASVGVVP